MPIENSIAPATSAPMTHIVAMPRGFACEIRIAPHGAGWRFGFLFSGPAEEYGHAESNATIAADGGAPFSTKAAAMAGALGVARIFFDRADAPGRDRAIAALIAWKKECRA
jgi:hypothetical protein